MSNYTINDSIFKLLFEAVKREIIRRRREHAIRRLNKAFEYADRLSTIPTKSIIKCFGIRGMWYVRTTRQVANEVFGEIIKKMEMERIENEN